MAKKGELKTLTINGIVMTVEERNRRMKLDHVNTGKPLKQLAEEYHLTYNTVRVISSNENWQGYRDKFAKDVSESIERELKDKYINNGMDITIQYHNEYQKIFYLVDQILEDKKSLVDKDGNISLYKLNTLVDILTKLQAGQNITTGFIGRSDAEALKIQKQAMALKELMAGVGDTEVIDDNFLEMLMDSAARQGIAKEGENNGNDKESKE